MTSILALNGGPGLVDHYNVNFPELKSQFIEAQRQWLKFRDKECEAGYLINQAGTQRNIDHLVCLRDRTADRVQQLQQWRDNL
jgi:uncharacterized protein YecT (DUF1311 family)